MRIVTSNKKTDKDKKTPKAPKKPAKESKKPIEDIIEQSEATGQELEEQDLDDLPDDLVPLLQETWQNQKPFESIKQMIPFVSFLAETLGQSHKQVKIFNETSQEDESILAECNFIAGYHHFLVTIFPPFYEMTLREQMCILIHEVLHAVRAEETSVGRGQLLETTLMGESNLNALRVHKNAFTIHMESATETLTTAFWLLIQKYVLG